MDSHSLDWMLSIGKAIYSAGLLVIGGALISGAPVAVRVAQDFVSALKAVTVALHAVAIDRDAVDRIESGVRRIERDIQAIKTEVKNKS